MTAPLRQLQCNLSTFATTTVTAPLRQLQCLLRTSGSAQRLSETVVTAAGYANPDSDAAVFRADILHAHGFGSIRILLQGGGTLPDTGNSPGSSTRRILVRGMLLRELDMINSDLSPRPRLDSGVARQLPDGVRTNRVITEVPRFPTTNYRGKMYGIRGRSVFKRQRGQTAWHLWHSC